MPHPQQHDLEVALAKFFADTDRSLEVVYVDAKKDTGGGATPIQDSVEFVHAWVGDETEDDLEALLSADDEKSEPHARVQLGTSADRRAAAERLGFTVKSRTAYQPSGRTVEIAYAEKAVGSPREAATTAIEWLQQASKIGSAWLWITDLSYDDWPRPLPRPAVWPPAG